MNEKKELITTATSFLLNSTSVLFYSFRWFVQKLYANYMYVRIV